MDEPALNLRGQEWTLLWRPPAIDHALVAPLCAGHLTVAPPCFMFVSLGLCGKPHEWVWGSLDIEPHVSGTLATTRDDFSLCFFFIPQADMAML
jgi:hypothetical protein